MRRAEHRCHPVDICVGISGASHIIQAGGKVCVSIQRGVLAHWLLNKHMAFKQQTKRSSVQGAWQRWSFKRQCAAHRDMGFA